MEITSAPDGLRSGEGEGKGRDNFETKNVRKKVNLGRIRRIKDKKEVL